jgi:tRNA(Arg) A34 adenosine deaminase TadA
MGLSHPPKPNSGPLNDYWDRAVKELVTMPLPEFDEAETERHRYYCHLLMALMAQYWNGNKRGHTGKYPGRTGQIGPDGRYHGGDYLGHNIGAIAVDAEGEIIDFDFNHNDILNSSVEHAESRLIRRIFSLASLNNGWATRDVADPHAPVPYSNILSDVTMYTSLESCAQCSGIMALGSVKQVVFLQRDPGQYSIGNILRQLSPANARYKPPLPIPGDALGLEVFANLNDGYEAYVRSLATQPFYTDEKGTPDKSPSITSFLCTDVALQAFEVGRKLLMEPGEPRFPEFKPKRKDGQPVPGALTNAQVMTHVQRFFAYARDDGRRGTPHRL